MAANVMPASNRSNDWSFTTPDATLAEEPEALDGMPADAQPAWLEATPCVVIVADLKGRVCFVNAEGRAALGSVTTDTLLTGRTLSEAFADESRTLIAQEGIPAALRFGIWQGEAVLRSERGAGTTVALWLSVRLPATDRLVCVACDITRQKKRERRLAHLATHDALTGLPNLTLFHDRLAQALNVARRQVRPFAVLFLDVDRFKQLNDKLGHETANRVLAELAVRLYSCVRAVDTVARYGGDEFAIILNGLSEATEVNLVIERIRACLRKPFSILGTKIEVAASIGVGVFPFDANDGLGLVVHADRDMYRHKRRARSMQHVPAPEGPLPEKPGAVTALRADTH